jgi:hypothetical protein
MNGGRSRTRWHNGGGVSDLFQPIFRLSYGGGSFHNFHLIEFRLVRCSPSHSTSYSLRFTLISDRCFFPVLSSYIQGSFMPVNTLLTSATGEKAKSRTDGPAQQKSRDRAAAGNAYSQPNPQEMERTSDLSGVPWGSLNMRHIIERGQARELEVAEQRSRKLSASYTQRSTQGLQTSAACYCSADGRVDNPPSYLQDQQYPSTIHSGRASQGETYGTWESSLRPSGRCDNPSTPKGEFQP